MKKKKLGVDIDGVVCDLNTELAKVLTGALGRQVHSSEFTRYDLSDFGFDGDIVVRCAEEDGAYVVADPYRYAPEVLRELSNSYDLVYVTARPERLWKDTIGWFNKQGIPYRDIYFTKHKSNKSLELGIELFIEDNPSNLADLNRNGVGTLKFVHRYNEHYKHELCREVFSWVDVARCLL